MHQHRLAEIAACQALSKRVKEGTASHKSQSKEKTLEVSSQHVQTMMDTYHGSNSGQFPNGGTNLENVSSRRPNLNIEYCQLTLLLSSDGF
jgi:hypothetical protein